MIRDVCESDIPRLIELQKQSGIEWELPNFSSPEVLSGRVFVDDQDQPIMFAGARKIAEVFAILDGKWGTPGLRSQAFTALYGAVEHDLETQGITEVTSWMPPQVFRGFYRRLQRTYGWTQSRWINVTGFVGGKRG